MAFWVYVLECYKSGRFSCYYVGQTNNFSERMEEHFDSVREGNTDTFVGRFDYVKPVWKKRVPTRADALRLESYLKSLTPQGKEDYMRRN